MTPLREVQNSCLSISPTLFIKEGWIPSVHILKCKTDCSTYRWWFHWQQAAPEDLCALSLGLWDPSDCSAIGWYYCHSCCSCPAFCLSEILNTFFLTCCFPSSRAHFWTTLYTSKYHLQSVSQDLQLGQIIHKFLIPRVWKLYSSY